MGAAIDKKTVRDFAAGLGADAVGFAAIEDYRSPRSPDPRKLLPGVRSIVVMGFAEMRGALESDYPRVGAMCRLGSFEVALGAAFRVARLLEKETATRAIPVAINSPVEMSQDTKGMVADVSARHAAVAAGLGVLGRHNLLISPTLGSGAVYTCVLSEYPFGSDPKVEQELCDRCGLCVEACPAKALEEEGRTDVGKCLRVCQPLGVGAVIGYFSKMLQRPPEEQVRMLRDPYFWDLYQAVAVGMSYNCIRCVAACPVGK